MSDPRVARLATIRAMADTMADDDPDLAAELRETAVRFEPKPEPVRFGPGDRILHGKRLKGTVIAIGREVAWMVWDDGWHGNASLRDLTLITPAKIKRHDWVLVIATGEYIRIGGVTVADRPEYRWESTYYTRDQIELAAYTPWKGDDE